MAKIKAVYKKTVTKNNTLLNIFFWGHYDAKHQNPGCKHLDLGAKQC